MSQTGEDTGNAPVEKTAIYAGHFSTPVLSTLLPLATAAEARFGIRPIFVVHGDNARALSELTDRGIETLPVPGALEYTGHSTATFNIVDMRRWIAFAKFHVNRVRAGRLFARELFDRHKPLAIFETSESQVIEHYLNGTDPR